MSGTDQMYEEIIKLKQQLHSMFEKHYSENELFSLTWWISIALIIIPIIIWWKVADKKRLLELCVYGLLVNVLATFLDVGLSDHMLWEYPVRVIPQTALFLPVDYIILPVIGTILYQKYPKWPSFLLACTIAGAFMAFVCEPFAVYIHMYRLIAWRYIYSFPLYIVLYAAIKFITEKMVSKTQTAR